MACIPLNKKAIIRIGADGDIFDLVENARYGHSAKDAKNHKAKDGFTDYFDYFYKTVQIDGKVFDININVKKQYGSGQGYTYTIKVADSKTMKASPALAVTQPSKVQGTPSATKIPRPTSKVNSQNSGTNSGRRNSLGQPLDAEGYGYLFDDQSDGNTEGVRGQGFGDSQSSGIKRSDRDSAGRQLTSEQQEFFAESKARDENGNLYVLFHGSRSPLFTEFDMNEGVWLTPDQRYAEVYAETWRNWRGESKDLTGLEESVYADPEYRKQIPDPKDS